MLSLPEAMDQLSTWARKGSRASWSIYKWGEKVGVSLTWWYGPGAHMWHTQQISEDIATAVGMALNKFNEWNRAN
jgi:hypothetical protein